MPIIGIWVIPRIVVGIWVIPRGVVGHGIIFFFRPQVNFTTFNLEIGLVRLVNFFDCLADDFASYGHFTVFAVNLRV